MDPVIKAEWVRRLREHPERQGKGCLGTSDGKRCCLGELCDMAVERGVISGPELMRPGGFARRLLYDRNEGQLLPLAVMHWAGLDSRDPELLGYREFHAAIKLTCSGMNDHDEMTWPHVADMIEWAL